MNYYEGLKYHNEEALSEAGKPILTAVNNPDIALFSREYYNQIQNLNHEKKYDYVFIGNLRDNIIHNRSWIIDFAKKHFTANSIFINTNTLGEENWKSLGVFDFTYTHKSKCFSPMNYNGDINQTKAVQYRIVSENKFYFETMCQSKFCLCPAGDCPWSFRFYEVLMCKSIPIVESWLHTFRTETESTFGYRYLLNTATHIFDPSIIEHNTNIFERNHLIPRLHIYTYATDVTKMESFCKSVKIFGNYVNCIVEHKWDGYYDKIFNILKNIKDVPDNEIICFVDGYDLFVNSKTDEIIDKFLKYKCDLLFGAELNCYPENETLKKTMDAIKCLTKYRYVNSGGYIGYASAIRKLLIWKSPVEIKKICEEGTDQLYFAEYFIANNVQLDYRQKIFQNMYRVSWREISVKNNRFYNKKIDEYPCFVHFSGGSSITKDLKRSVIPILLEFIEKNDENEHLLDNEINFEPLPQV
jgi:hypothetical protein